MCIATIVSGLIGAMEDHMRKAMFNDGTTKGMWRERCERRDRSKNGDFDICESAHVHLTSAPPAYLSARVQHYQAADQPTEARVRLKEPEQGLVWPLRRQRIRAVNPTQTISVKLMTPQHSQPLPMIHDQLCDKGTCNR